MSAKIKIEKKKKIMLKNP